MKQIPLTQGKVALMDDDIYEAIGHLKWYAHKEGNTYYVVRSIRGDDGKQHNLPIHHCVMGFPLGNNEIDHRDGNGLNNQRSNLRIATRRKNQQDRQRHRKGKLSGASFIKIKYKNKVYSYWQAHIRINGKRKSLGYFKTEQEAHEAYMQFLSKENL